MFNQICELLHRDEIETEWYRTPKDNLSRLPNAWIMRLVREINLNAQRISKASKLINDMTALNVKLTTRLERTKKVEMMDAV